MSQDVIQITVSDNSDSVQINATPNLYSVNIVKGQSIYQVVTSVNGLQGDVTITKFTLGLGNVDNTADLSKPISTATKTALNAKQDSLTLTTTGTSGSATLIGNTLNIPSYASGGGSGTVTSVGLTAPTGFSVSGSPVTTSGSLAFAFATGYSLPSDATQATWTAKQAALSGTGFVKSTAGTISYDTNTYITGNQNISVSGDVSGSGTTSITTALATISQAATGSFVKVTIDSKGRVTGNTAVGSSDITTALGFTPYNVTNPSGYTNNTGTVTSVAALTLGTSGTDLGSSVATGTTTPVITLNVPTASASNRGALSSADWSTFNGKQGALTLTTTGTSGASTLVGNTLNIPNYASGGGSGTVTSVSVVSANGLAGTVATATTTPAITLSTSVTGLLKGNGTAISAATAGTDYQAPLSGTGFVKSTAGTISYDTNTYITGNQSITLSGAVTGSGSTAISTSLASSVVGVSNLSATGTPSSTTYLRGDNTWATVSGSSFSGTLAAGTATVAPLDYTLSGAVLKTTPLAGDFECDSAGISYYSHADSSRGVMHTEQFISLSATPYTLTSQTAAQKMFNTTTNGALTVAGSTTYTFECFFSLSSMSATTGAFGFALGGTATLTSIGWTSQALKATTQTTAATLQTTYNTTAANTAIVGTSTQTGGFAKITGMIRTNAGGTLIPQVSLGVAAAAIVGINSYFKIIPLGTSTVNSIGNWS